MRPPSTSSLESWGFKKRRTSNCLKQGQASAEIQLDPLKGRPDTSSQPRKNRDKRMVSRRRRLRSCVNLLVSDYRPFLFFYIKFPRQEAEEAEEAVSFARLVEIFRPKRSFCVFRQREVFDLRGRTTEGTKKKWRRLPCKNRLRKRCRRIWPKRSSVEDRAKRGPLSSLAEGGLGMLPD